MHNRHSTVKRVLGANVHDTGRDGSKRSGRGQTSSRGETKEHDYAYTDAQHAPKWPVSSDLSGVVRSDHRRARDVRSTNTQLVTRLSTLGHVIPTITSNPPRHSGRSHVQESHVVTCRWQFSSDQSVHCMCLAPPPHFQTKGWQKEGHFLDSPRCCCSVYRLSHLVGSRTQWAEGIR